MENNNENELMTVKEAAEYLRVQEPTIRTWIRKGRLSALRSEMTDVVRLLRSDVKNFLAKKEGID